MNSLTVFNFDDLEVRTVVDEKGNPWFHASDCAKALGYKNPSKAVLDNVSPKYNQQLDLETPGSFPLFISEPGLYQLVMKSRLPSAERFQDWVFEEVLPTIRKTEKYEVPQQSKLPSRIEALETARAVAEIEGLLNHNPRLAQCLIDHALNDVLGGQKLLEASRLRGVVEIAIDMGFTTAKNPSVRAKLGRFVSKMVGQLSQLEERLCNGTMQQIKCYPDTPEVREAVGSFFIKEPEYTGF